MVVCVPASSCAFFVGFGFVGFFDGARLGAFLGGSSAFP